ncbi:MAG: hypothetical protein IPL78_22615 [Chloroflexi bacterium]|nr:hypothetical protein [Chloroflexota bacterium]
MKKLDKEQFVNECIKDGPQSAMEKMLLHEYLQGKGYQLADLQGLPEAQVKALMTEACQYASLRLAQVESTAHLREKIHVPA